MSACTILLLGTATFAIPSAETLRASDTCALLGVVTKPDARTGRTRAPAPPPLAAWARAHDVRVWQPKMKQEVTALLRELRPDVCVTVAYGKIIPAEALTIPRFGFLNLHPSLLPRWRGASPIQAAIAAGDRDTGVTIIRLDAGMDTGPIVAQERTPLPPTATRSAVESDLAQRGAQLLARVLPDYLAGHITPQPQDNTQATTCPLLTREDGRIDWKESAGAIERKVRAYEGWPGSWTVLHGPAAISNFSAFGGSAGGGKSQNANDGKRLKILSALRGSPTDTPPGTILRDAHGRMTVACGDGQALILTRVQPEGKPPMDGAEFLRGWRGHSRLDG